MVGRRFVAVKVEEAMNYAIKIEDKKSAMKLHSFLCTIMDSMDCTSNIKLSDEDIKKMYNELKEDLFIYL